MPFTCSASMQLQLTNLRTETNTPKIFVHPGAPKASRHTTHPAARIVVTLYEIEENERKRQSDESAGP